MPRARKPRQRRSPRDSQGTATALLAAVRAPDREMLRAIIDAIDTKLLYDYMQATGKALAVHFDLATERWECAWIVGTVHHVGVSTHPRVAIVAAASQALD